MVDNAFYPGTNRLTGQNFTDPNNPTLRTLTWNADNMPVSVSSGGVTTSLTYDGMGQRAKKQVGAGSPTYYIGAEYEVIAGVGTTYIFAGNLRIAKVSASGVYYFHKDHLGSSTVMTGDTGAMVETSEYRPYGSFRSQTGTEVSDYKFTDQEWDAESGLYNYDARLYDPVIGRFISADSIVSKPFDPQCLNRFSYTRDNPLIYYDPDGHSFGEVGKGGKADFGGTTVNGNDIDTSGYSETADIGPLSEPSDPRTAWNNNSYQNSAAAVWNGDAPAKCMESRLHTFAGNNYVVQRYIGEDGIESIKAINIDNKGINDPEIIEIFGSGRSLNDILNMTPEQRRQALIELGYVAGGTVVVVGGVVLAAEFAPAFAALAQTPAGAMFVTEAKNVVMSAIPGIPPEGPFSWGNLIGAAAQAVYKYFQDE